MREKEKMPLARREELNKIYWRASILISAPVCIIVILSVLAGAERTTIFIRVAQMLTPILAFFIGLIGGVKMVYRLKTGEILGEEKIKESSDGVTK